MTFFCFAGKPHLTVHNTCKGHDTYQLDTVNGNLMVANRGRVCIDAHCDSEKPIHYSWYKSNSTEDNDYHLLKDYKDNECYFDGNRTSPDSVSDLDKQWHCYSYYFHATIDPPRPSLSSYTINIHFLDISCKTLPMFGICISCMSKYRSPELNFFRREV